MSLNNVVTFPVVLVKSVKSEWSAALLRKKYVGKQSNRRSEHATVPGQGCLIPTSPKKGKGCDESHSFLYTTHKNNFSRNSQAYFPL